MARVGEGDPRWIVDDRKDGHNVNAWHWEERDLSSECHEELKRRLKNVTLVKEADLELRVDELSEVSGDVTVAQRKGKMMCYFELKLTLKWSAGDDVTGKITIPEIDHDNFRNEYEVTISVTENDAASQRADALMRSKGRAPVRNVIMKYFEELFEIYQIGKSLKNASSLPPPTKRNEITPVGGSAKSGNAGTASEDSAPTSFSWKMRWRIPVEELFTVLMNEQRASVYTRAQAKIDPRSGGAFELLGGVISGFFVEVVPNATIKMQWRLRSWPSGVHSSVVMVLKKEESGVSTLEVAQVGIPEGELQVVQEGWKANFFDAIKMVFGYSMEYI
ncbi:putative activator of 90 kDa heat shock protein ATPase 1-like [Trypanosoma rangeli]|uniref:Putative activator of 90 kDa heat shock protein ATPase 1-like n=1 Tax=Trypanosoma rangeli TaxID=5698 RepID=A0A3R7MY48_TRYRA|nr:putative activator of 90 kDa heat shock protein ATPase 1-like [Trypanosoma rangeli]RNF09856.1 putative activator of 90 kDa heat shock protein ATPase 1-like [Trypanosoma rangeli]|eukprot:RNF09856.1 putative activator of 90 kDa heat shock protein ATPase 1-like [Trypanosoma rangeli]